MSLPECLRRVVGNVDGQKQEAGSDESECEPLRRLSPNLVGVPSEPPQRRKTAGHLDGGVEAKADEGNATGDEPSRERNRTLSRVPRDGEVLQCAAVAGGESSLFTSSARNSHGRPDGHSLRPATATF